MRWNTINSELANRINNGNMFRSDDPLTASALNEIVTELFNALVKLDGRFGEELIDFLRNGRQFNWTRTNGELQSAIINLPLPGARIFAKDATPIINERPNMVGVQIDNKEDSITITINETQCLYENEIVDGHNPTYFVAIDFFGDAQFTKSIAKANITINYDASIRAIDFLSGQNVINWTREVGPLLSHTITAHTSDFTNLTVFAQAEVPSNLQNRIGVSIDRNQNSITLTVNELENLRNDISISGLQIFRIPINFTRDSIHGTSIGRSEIIINYYANQTALIDFLAGEHPLNWTRSAHQNFHEFWIMFAQTGRLLYAVDAIQPPLTEFFELMIWNSPTNINMFLIERTNLRDNQTIFGPHRFIVPIDYFTDSSRNVRLGRSDVVVNYNANQTINWIRGSGPLLTRNFPIPSHNGNILFAQVANAPAVIDVQTTGNTITILETTNLRTNGSINGAQTFTVTVDFFTNSTGNVLISRNAVTINYYATPLTPID